MNTARRFWASWLPWKVLLAIIYFAESACALSDFRTHVWTWWAGLACTALISVVVTRALVQQFQSLRGQIAD